MGKFTLVLGGARSGKSAFAEGLVREAEAAGKAPLYVATYERLPGDGEMALRVERHRRRRPPSWLTVEEPRKLDEALAGAGAGHIVLVDCLSIWVSNLLLAEGVAGAEEAVEAGVSAFCRAVRSSPAEVVAVSGETGWGVIPTSSLGRLYRDLLGLANQEAARHADEVWLVIAGLPQRLK